jgi:hypothetical protein
MVRMPTSGERGSSTMELTEEVRTLGGDESSGMGRSLQDED